MNLSKKVIFLSILLIMTLFLLSACNNYKGLNISQYNKYYFRLEPRYIDSDFPLNINFTVKSNFEFASCRLDYGDNIKEVKYGEDCNKFSHTYKNPKRYIIILLVQSLDGVFIGDDFASITPKIKSYCIDSDNSDPSPGWNNWYPGYNGTVTQDNYVKGKTAGYDLYSIKYNNDYSYREFFDTCITTNFFYGDNKLDERYCYDENTSIGSRIIECPNGCSNGTCIN